MEKRIIGTFVFILLIVLSFQVPATEIFNININSKITNNEIHDSMKHSSPPQLTMDFFDDILEITDEEGDTRFDYVDVIWASFYEKPNEPAYLYVALKISNLQDKIGCVYAIHWYFNNVHYDVGVHNDILIPYREFKSWSSDYYTKRSYVNTWDDSLNSGSFDLQNSIIIWKLHKSCIGFPQLADVLTHLSVFSAQRISSIGLILFGMLFRSFSDGSVASDSIDYIIQY